MNDFKTSTTGSTYVYVRGDSFPIIGKCTPELKEVIRRERLQAANDVLDTYIDATISFENRVDVYEPAIIIRRDEGKIILDAVTDYRMNEDGTLPPIDPKQMLASTSIPVSMLLRVSKAYFENLNVDESLIREFDAAGNFDAITDIDLERKNFHFAMAYAIAEYLENADADIQFRRVTSGGSDGFAQWRYLATALTMLVLPARSFEDMSLLVKNIKPKYDARFHTRSEAVEDVGGKPLRLSF